MHPSGRTLSTLMVIPLLLTGCGNSLTSSHPAAVPGVPLSPSATPHLQTAVPSPIVPVQPMDGVHYRNLFQEYLDRTDAEIQAKLEAAWQQLFYGSDDSQRVYYPIGEDMAYIEDIGNGDVRTEGISYGMMIAVQLDKKAEFDRLWKWAKTYMYQNDGPFKGYFAWHCSPDGTKLDTVAAPDGEEWFGMALFFASGLWGDGEGFFDYQAQAQQILHVMLHKHEENTIVTDMFDPQAKQVVFVPVGKGATFTDPSYQLPAYYELWARWADKDNAFWAEAADASRLFFRRAVHPQTGLMPDYAAFDGTPATQDDHKDFRFDAWRTLSNVAVDYVWFGADPWQVEQSNRVLNFLASQGMESYPNQYSLSGEPLSGDHSTGLVSMAAVAALAADENTGKPFVQALWDVSVPSGKWRYYDGMLYLLGLLHVSGNFKIYAPR